MGKIDSGNAPETLNFSLLFETIANEAILGIVAFDAKTGSCLYINRLAREVLELGSDVSFTSNLKLADLIPGSVRPGSTALSETFLLTEGMRQNVLIKKRDGHLIFANTGVRHVDSLRADRIHLLMFQDVTVQRKLQRDLETKQEEIKAALNQVLEQNKQLVELDSSKDRFIALTTHELRTPLSAIVATSEVLVLKFYESAEQKEEFIKTIHEQGLQLMELVNDILDYAKIRAGKMELYVEEFDLVPLVSKLSSTFDHMAQQANVKLTIRGSEKLTAFADQLRLREVISNVVNNAIKYNRDGGTVTVSFAAGENNMARITVSDTGQGIPDDKLHHVFNEFETVGGVSSHHKGTGLGMPISKRLTLAMGGDLTLSSVPGQGTSFYLDLPTTRILSPDVYRTRDTDSFDLVA